MSDLTTNESADVLMHNGQQYVRVDYLTREKAKCDRLTEALRAFLDYDACDTNNDPDGFIVREAYDDAISKARAALGEQP